MKTAKLLSCFTLLAVFLKECPWPLLAQSLSSPAFEVSSVKESSPGVFQGSIRQVDVGIIAVNGMTLRELVLLCYHLRPYQIIGGPSWLNQNRFDVVGKDSLRDESARKLDARDPSAILDGNDEKFQGLLAERFGLKVHHETRVLSAFNLAIEKKHRFSQVSCATSYRLQHGWVEGAIRVASLAALLKVEMGSPVIDTTGLSGCYQMVGRWTTDPADTSQPQLSTALSDLGFRLQPTRVDVDVLVIDHADHPQPD